MSHGKPSCECCYGWWLDGKIRRREFRQDHGGGPEEIPHRKSRAKAKKPREGCPGNDGNAHIYVWIRYAARLKSGGEYADYYRMCVGCSKKKRRTFGFVPDEVYETRYVPDWWTL